MIVSVRDSGVLELYRRHPVSERPNRRKAIDFVSAFVHGVNKLRAIHAYLSKTSEQRCSDTVAIERLAGQIASGDIVVLQRKGEPRWPGTRLFVQPLSPAILLLARTAAESARSEAQARSWLQEAEDADLESVYRTLCIGYRRSAVLAGSREACSGEIERLLDTGELVPVYHPLPVHVETVIRAAPANAAPPPRPERLPPENNTFDSGHAGKEQAAALIGASDEGFGVCEVCNRARERRARGKRKPKHWIEIQLVAEDGIPVPGVEYRVKLPSGEVVTGYLDTNGSARVDNIEQPGTCQVSFPTLDKKEWKPWP